MPKDKSKSATPEVAPLDWIDGSIPWSPRFADTYYSRAGGLAETGHVFIAGNDLPARWPGMRDCLIAELGFGTGLNFLETVRQWQQTASTGARLRFISFERYPLPAADMEKALSRWPELGVIANRLVAVWEPETATVHTEFTRDVELTVFMGDAAAILPQQDFEANAWYLDGFAPSRNPDLWSADLLKQVFARTAPGGSFATYTAAGQVRRDLQTAGFDVERRQGFAGKREMLAGRRPA